MIISEKQIMRLMDFVNDYALILKHSETRGNMEIYNSIRLLLDSITAQQSEELKEIKK